MRVRLGIIFCLFLCGTMIFSAIEVAMQPASVTPIIETPESHMGVDIGESFTLVFFIIDDNPFNYSLARNESRLDFGLIHSNRLQFTRQETEGFYNFTLEVMDYSQNTAALSILVSVGYEVEAEEEDAAPGMEFLPMALGLLFLIRRRARRKRMNKGNQVEN
ncbi:MAG: hypothetical protein ACFFB3_17365 [Candidatus Hodarchaeota archaeon]